MGTEPLPRKSVALPPLERLAPNGGEPASALISLREKRERLAAETEANERFFYRFQGAFYIYFLLALGAELILAEIVLAWLTDSGFASPGFSDWMARVGYAGRVGFFWLFTLIAGGIIFYTVRRPLERQQQQLTELDEQIRLMRTVTMHDRRLYLQEELRRLTTAAARVFLDNPDRSRLVNAWRQRAEDILEQIERREQGQLEGTAGREPDLGEAESLISQINELIWREESELREQRNWRYVAVGIMLAYVGMLVTVVVATSSGQVQDTPLPMLGVPLSVIFWGAAGSLAAILSKFHAERKRVRLDLEVRWLIARPIIGIIMGGLSYLAIAAGMLLLNQGGGNVTTTSVREIAWIIAFLAGFSDKLYLLVIDLLVGRAAGQREEAGDNGARREKPAAQFEAVKPQASSLSNGSKD